MHTATFDVTAVQPLVRHALDAPTHQSGYGGAFDATPPTPGLLVVKDDGIYLMSNGVPRQTCTGCDHHGDKAPGHAAVVYAHRHHPHRADHSWDRDREVAGGDDFIEPLLDLDTAAAERIFDAESGTLTVTFTDDTLTVELRVPAGP